MMTFTLHSHCLPHRKQTTSITKTSQVMLLTETITVYSKNHTRPITTQWEECDF